MNKKVENYAKTAKGKAGFARVVGAFGYSKDGLRAAYQGEAAFRQVVWLNGVLFVLLIFLPFALLVKMVLVLAGGLSVVVELFNTGLEAAIDHTSTDHHPLAKVAKDVGSAAQLVMLVTLFLLWVLAICQLGQPLPS